MKFRFLILSLVAVGTLCAQPPRGFHGNATSGTPPAPPTPAEQATRETARLTRFLNLDPTTQQPEILAILTTEYTQLQANAPALQTLRTSLATAIKTNPGQIDSVLLQISPLQEQQDAIRAKATAQVYALLSADQKTKLGDGLGLLGSGPGGPGRFGPRR